MSYDLYLYSSKLSREAFNSYFANRPNYNQDGWYTNENTGVYFSFSYEEPEIDDDISESEAVFTGPFVAFNMNYYRPHVFGLEAEPEVAAFVRQFDCVVNDPQIGGMGDGPFSSDGFLRGWNEGNAYGYEGIHSGEHDTNVLVVADVLIEQVWRWNLNHQRLQEQTPDHFLPTVYWAKEEKSKSTITYVVWGEGVSVAVPDFVTHALLARKRRVFAGTRDGFEVRLVPLTDIERLPGCEWSDATVSRLLLAPKNLPPSRDILALFDSKFGEVDDIIKRYSPDMVLNESIIKRGR